MKNIIIKLIKLYQLIPNNSHNMCRFYPTCSNYAITAIDNYGALKGSVLAIKRIFRCNPWGSMGYDPVPERKK